MPKFTEQEREAIQKTLRTKGEDLFCAGGLKKVTIEEIARAAQISKGSFYAFYSSKEELYFGILAECQQDIWRRLEKSLKQHADLPPKKLVALGINQVIKLMQNYPLIARTDSATLELLMRKLPNTTLHSHLDEDAQALALFTRHGVRFTKPAPVVAAAFQALYGALVNLAGAKKELAAEVTQLMINGLVNELVEEER